MPISSPASYLPTCDEFIAHWELANAANSAKIQLRDGSWRFDLETMRNDLAEQITQLTQTLNDREYARGDINTRVRKLLERLEEFNNRIRAIYEPDSRYVNALPAKPAPDRNASIITRALDDVAGIWGNLNAEGTALVLFNGYTLEQFNTGIAALKDSYQQYQTALTKVKFARATRNETQGKIQPLLKLYRQTIPALFPPDSAIVQSLPRLTPLPGSTPNPVNASGVWDASEQKARLNWEASDSAKLKEYEVRYTPGDKYESDDASVIANVEPEEPRELLTNAGLTQPGSESTYKVFVVTETGNEAGSDSLTVEWPAG